MIFNRIKRIFYLTRKRTVFWVLLAIILYCVFMPGGQDISGYVNPNDSQTYKLWYYFVGESPSRNEIEKEEAYDDLWRIAYGANMNSSLTPAFLALMFVGLTFGSDLHKRNFEGMVMRGCKKRNIYAGQFIWSLIVVLFLYFLGAACAFLRGRYLWEGRIDGSDLVFLLRPIGFWVLYGFMLIALFQMFFTVLSFRNSIVSLLLAFLGLFILTKLVDGVTGMVVTGNWNGIGKNTGGVMNYFAYDVPISSNPYGYVPIISNPDEWRMWGEWQQIFYIGIGVVAYAFGQIWFCRKDG